ncbi:MAG: hypothetical protein EOM37_11600 [Proteobacteria bacterium]|nr:hypothetical protein [Pseudomonadota bacterium]
MLQLGDVVIKNDEYYIKKMFTGIDELFFDISIWDEHYPLVTEEASILETERGQTYLVKAIDGGGSTATIRCLIDLDDFYGTIVVPYTNSSATLASTVSMPSGWSFTDSSASSITRTVELPSATPMDILNQCRDTYGVIFRFDNKLKKVTAYNPEGGSFAGAFMTRDLNLKEINYKGASTDIITALYCVGKDGLTFSSINGGNPYITNGAYKSKLIWGYWKDERYTDAASLLEDATAKLAQLSVPARSYQCDVVDLAKTNPDLYAHQDFDLLKVVDLVDDSRGVTIRNKVVEYVDYPYYPERNIVTISTTTPKIHLDVKQINVALNNPNSTFQQVTSAAQASATKQILSGDGGYVVMNTNADNRITEILIMDTDDIATATKVWRWNTAGLGYSSTGYDGTYTTAITQDGAIVADFITTGTLNAALINVINLVAEHVRAEDDSQNTLEVNSGEITMFSGDAFRAIMRARTDGTAGFSMVLSGNTEYPELGSPFSSALLDSDARLTLIQPNAIWVGLDKDNVARGYIYASDAHIPWLYVTKIIIEGGSPYTVAWKQVNLAAGGTAWALCQA